MLRKINAYLSLFITILLLNHAISHAAWMLSGGKVAIKPICSPWVMFCAMLLHAIICIAFAILGHKGAEKRKYKSYPNMNVSTEIQRISGVSLIVFTVLHIAGAIGIIQPPKIVHVIFSPLFFAVCMLHTAISTSKAFITLGIGNARFVKITDVAMKVICTVTLIADVVGFYLYKG